MCASAFIDYLSPRSPYAAKVHRICRFHGERKPTSNTVFLIESRKRVDDEALQRESCVRPLSAQWNICWWRFLLKVWPYNNSLRVAFHCTLTLHCVHFPCEQSLVAGVVATFINESFSRGVGGEGGGKSGPE